MCCASLPARNTPLESGKIVGAVAHCDLSSLPSVSNLYRRLQSFKLVGEPFWDYIFPTNELDSWRSPPGPIPAAS